jgi:hypothetical protein
MGYSGNGGGQIGGDFSVAKKKPQKTAQDGGNSLSRTPAPLGGITQDESGNIPGMKFIELYLPPSKAMGQKPPDDSLILPRAGRIEATLLHKETKKILFHEINGRANRRLWGRKNARLAQMPKKKIQRWNIAASIGNTPPARS